jgi:CRISPR/Cas system-associated protein endoribonuclease Cas2
LAIHAKGGESISPKQKDRTTTNFQNLKLRKGFKMMNFSMISYCIQKGGESTILKIGILKPS